MAYDQMETLLFDRTDSGVLTITLNRPAGTNVKKLGMNVPREQMKIQICDFRPRG